jgi:hypothetical protein
MDARAEMPSSCGSASKKKQMLLTEELSLHIANILYAYLEDPESKFSKFLEKSGGPAAIQSLEEFLMESEHPHRKDKSTTVPTVTESIEKLKSAAEKENQHQIDDSSKLPKRKLLQNSGHDIVLQRFQFHCYDFSKCYSLSILLLNLLMFVRCDVCSL